MEHIAHAVDSVQLGPLAVGAINCLIFMTLGHFGEIVQRDDHGRLLEEPEDLHGVPREDEHVVEKRVGVRHLFYY